jgi:hypothetical protein
MLTRTESARTLTNLRHSVGVVTPTLREIRLGTRDSQVERNSIALIQALATDHKTRVVGKSNAPALIANAQAVAKRA